MLIEEPGSGGLRELILAGGRGHALDLAGLRELARAFDPARAEAGPVVLRAEGNSFCTGLDLVAALELERAGMRELMRAFHTALRAVALWPHPVVAAIQGHALAGGALLALAADLRVMAHGPHRFGIHGVQLGVVYPQVAIELVRWRVARALAEELLFAGRLRPAHQAFTEGLVEELVDAPLLLDRARELALARAGGSAAVAIKARVNAPLAASTAELDPEWEEAWLDHWFAPATRLRLQAARTALLGRGLVRPGEDPR